MLHASRRRRQGQGVRKRVKILLALFIVVILGFGLLKVFQALPFLWDTVAKKEIALKKTPEKKVNLLILGVGGEKHDGPNLTDTIIFAQIDPEKKNVRMVSLPRDLWIPDTQSKVNHIYTLADENDPGSGLATNKKKISEVLGQPIDYAIKIDFNGFVKAIDMVDGLDIDVTRTFDDYEYPVAGKEAASCGHTEAEIASLSAELASESATMTIMDAFPCRYEHLHFDKGPTHMDGETALKFVRSRHALGKEGSDFARSKRQEKVINAFKDKLFSVGTILNPMKASSLFGVFKDSVEMDIKQDELDDFIRLAQKLEGAKITSAVIDMGDASDDRLGLLMNPPISPLYGNQWVLAPRNGPDDYTEIQQFVGCYLKGKTCMVGEYGIVTPTPKPTKIPTPTRSVEL
ncbi:MAG: LCP family protein [Patescibacteria group bacterium]